MSLIKCPECGHKISEYAEKCPECNCPMDKIKELLSIQSKIKTISKSKTYQCINNKQKELVNELYDFINNNTSLIFIDHGTNFGFRKDNHAKMVIIFCIEEGEFTLRFRNKNFKPNSYDIKKYEMENIKSAILKYYSNKKVKKESKPAKSIVPKKILQPFTFSEYLQFANNLKNRLNSNIPNLKVVISQDAYYFSVNIEKNPYYLCNTFYSEKGADIEYYPNGSFDNKVQKIVSDPNNELDTICENVLEVYQDICKKVKEKKIAESKLYNLIIKAINDNYLQGSIAINKKAIEVAKFVNDIVSGDAIAKGIFKTKEEFIKFKKAYFFKPVLFGHAFVYKNVTADDAKEFYNSYKAIKLVSIIREYENLLKIKIIEKEYDLVLSLKEIVYTRKYYLAKGINSDFSLVPTSLFDEVLDELEKYEEI